MHEKTFKLQVILIVEMKLETMKAVMIYQLLLKMILVHLILKDG